MWNHNSDVLGSAAVLNWVQFAWVRGTRKTLDSTMDTITRLMKEVECEEKAAEQAKAEAESAWSCSDTIAKLNELQQAHECTEATEMETLQLRVASLLDNGNRSLELLNEMDRALNIRWTSASMKRKLAILKKQEGEASAAAAVAYEEMQLEKLILEFKRLKQEAADTSKVVCSNVTKGCLELCFGKCYLIITPGEISDKCRDVKLLKEELDQAISLNGILSSRQTLSILHCQTQPEQADSDVLLKNCSGLGSFDTTEDHIQSVNHEQISRDSRLLGKKSAKHIKNVRTKNKLHGSRGYARSIKKVKIQCKLHEIWMLAKRIKKVKRKAKLHGTRMSAKSVKKVKIKTKLHGNRKTLDSTMDAVTRLMKEVECEEKAAEQAKAEAESAWSCSDTIAKLNELQQAQLHVKIANDLLASEVNAQKQHLATEMETLQPRVASLLDKGNRSLELFFLGREMDRALDIRWISISRKRKLAILKKQEGEASDAAPVAYEEMQMEKLILDSRDKNKKQQTFKEFLINRACAVDMLHGEISDKCRDVKLPQEELDQAIPLNGIMSSRQTLSILHCQPQTEQDDSDVLFKDCSGLGSFDTTEDHIQSVNHKQIRSRDSRVLGKTSAKHIKNVRTKNKLHGSRGIKKVKRKAKLHGTRMSNKSVKKVKIKTKLHGNRVFGQSNNKRKIEGSFEADIKIGPAVAEITEVGQGKSTECSEDTYAEGLALRSTMKKETGQRSKRKTKKVMKYSGWDRSPRRFASAGDPRGLLLMRLVRFHSTLFVSSRRFVIVS
ncbi:hypothetical protein Tco_0432630 [Tanacetum coccineum]